MKPTQWEEIQRDIDALAHTNPSHEEWIMWIERNFNRAITLAEDRGLERAAGIASEWKIEMNFQERGLKGQIVINDAGEKIAESIRKLKTL